jgi:hypothetical protein
MNKNIFNSITMKKSLSLICFIALFCGSIAAQSKKFHPAIILRQDGTIVECFAQYPKSWVAKEIVYRDAQGKKNQSMKSDEIITVRYVFENDIIVEYDRYQTITFANLHKGNKKLSVPTYLNVKTRGLVTLYHNKRQSSKLGTEHFFHCKRENEDFASLLSVGKGLYGNSFKKVAGDYFADSPSISEKIRNGENGYQAHDIEEIVMEYNAEKLAQK